MTTVAAMHDADEILARMRADLESEWPRILFGRVQRGDKLQARPLTHSESRALQLASFGMGVRECSVLMGVSVESVKSFWRQARRKLAAKNTTHAVAIAIRTGLIV